MSNNHVHKTPSGPPPPYSEVTPHVQQRHKQCLAKVEHGQGPARLQGVLRIAQDAPITHSIFTELSIKISGHSEVRAGVFAHGNARIEGNARVCGKMNIGQFLAVMGNAQIFENIHVGGNAMFFEEARVVGNLYVEGGLEIGHRARIRGNVHVGGNLVIEEYGKISGEVHVDGDLSVFGEAVISGNVYVGGRITVASLPARINGHRSSHGGRHS